MKDPMWALDVLELLQSTDPSWRLHLVGNDSPGSNADKLTREYFEAFDCRVKSFDGTVVRLGFRADLLSVFRDIGVILSSSRVEGAPVSVQEGVASGALPVVRDWPTLKPIQAAQQLYPTKWIVDTPEEAAARILEWAPVTDHQVAEGEFREWAISQFDAAATVEQLDSILLSNGPTQSQFL